MEEEEVKTEFKDGELNLHLPKSEKAKPYLWMPTDREPFTNERRDTLLGRLFFLLHTSMAV
jgi:hypothetical protein